MISLNLLVVLLTVLFVPYQSFSLKQRILLFIALFVIMLGIAHYRKGEMFEGFDNTEAIQNLASMYNSGTITASNLNITGNLTVGGTSNMNGATNMSGSTNISNLTAGTASITGNATIGGTTTMNDDLTLNAVYGTWGSRIKMYGTYEGTQLPTPAVIESRYGWDPAAGGTDTYVEGTNAQQNRNIPRIVLQDTDLHLSSEFHQSPAPSQANNPGLGGRFILTQPSAFTATGSIGSVVGATGQGWTGSTGANNTFMSMDRNATFVGTGSVTNGVQMAIVPTH